MLTHARAPAPAGTVTRTMTRTVTRTFSDDDSDRVPDPRTAHVPAAARTRRAWTGGLVCLRVCVCVRAREGVCVYARARACVRACACGPRVG